MKNKLLLIDALGLIYRGHYAFIKNPLRASDGMVTSGLYHLLSEIYGAVDKYNPELIAVVFDHPAPSFRKQIFPAYKANRPPMPEELIVQSEQARNLVRILGFPVIEIEGLEADDLIASLTETASGKSMDVVIISMDKDFFQLLTNRNVKIHQPGKSGRPYRIIAGNDLPDIIGVRSEQFVDFLSLTGDSSDNIPGAKGIGPKTAIKLLEDFESVDTLYSRLDSIDNEKLRNRLESGREQVLLSRKLVRLKSDPLQGIELDHLKWIEPDSSKALMMLSRFGFTSFEKNIRSGEEASGIDRTLTFDVEIISDNRKLAELEKILLSDNGAIALDTETDSLNPVDATPVGISLCCSESTAWYLPLSGKILPDRGKVISSLRAISEKRPLIAQNAKYDLHVLRNMGISWKEISGDPYIADYLLSPGAGGHSLESLSLRLLGKKLHDFKSVLGFANTLLEVPMEKVAEYCCQDSIVAWRLNRILGEELGNDDRLLSLYRDIELPLEKVLMEMERRGIALDTAVIAELRDLYNAKLLELNEEAIKMVGYHINLNSPSQVSHVLFKVLGLKPVRKTGKGSFSSSMTVLLQLSGQHPFVDLVIEFRELSKLLSTYINKLPEYISQNTGLIHTNFNQAVTSTGRLSSSGPNLQNIPIRTERGRKIRECFLPAGKNEFFISADYSQIELRVLAHLSGDEKLKEDYENDEDIHSRTALAIFGDASPEHRRKAKEINFSIIYGISAYGLASRLGISRGEAAGIIEKYFITYPGVKSFIEECVEETDRKGETRTITGRRRLFPDFSSAKGNRRKTLERVAVNSVVQGSAADIIKIAMIRVSERLSREIPDSGLVLQVHDELVATAPKRMVEEVRLILSEEMEKSGDLSIPLRVETGTGRNWLDAGH